MSSYTLGEAVSSPNTGGMGTAPSSSYTLGEAVATPTFGDKVKGVVADVGGSIAASAGNAFEYALPKLADVSLDLLEGGVGVTRDFVSVVLDPEFSLSPRNATAFANYMGSSIIGGDSSKITEEFLATSDVLKAKEAVSLAIEDGRRTVSYPDWGFKDGKATLLKENFIKDSFTDAGFRMATLLGTASIEVEGDSVYLVDRYDFNPGPLGNKYKKLLEEDEEAASDFLSEYPRMMQIRIWAAAKGHEVPEDNVRILVGTADEFGLITKAPPSRKVVQQLSALGLRPEDLQYFATDTDAEEAMVSGELKAGGAYSLPDGTVKVVEE